MLWMRNVWVLTRKEVSSFLSDRILFGFLIIAFTFLIYNDAVGVDTEVTNAGVAIVDADDSALSRRLRDALLPPQFKPADRIDRSRVDAVMDAGSHAFVIDIPPSFEADILRGLQPALQLNIDATAMTQAGVGSAYIEEILISETMRYLQMDDIMTRIPAVPVTRAMFNPNLDAIWFQAIEALIEQITLFALLLVGAAVIREREHGTIEHLLVMPLRASEIAAAKVLANGLIVLLATAVAVAFTVRLVLQVPVLGSVPLFLFGAALYIFSITSLGIMLSTVARTMPQFGLLVVPVFLFLRMLSGSTSPLDSLPEPLFLIPHASPTVHFVIFAQAVLFRDAGLVAVLPQLAVVSLLGAGFLAIALLRFRRMLTLQA
ncbi:ABC transporter permease [Yoonia sp. R2-816]|uniref:ABC transporter permease n=1 Tax=Yoonia sp. R2-816 TaxID=3342638 RepID=UPI0037265739